MNRSGGPKVFVGLYYAGISASGSLRDRHERI